MLALPCLRRRLPGPSLPLFEFAFVTMTDPPWRELLVCCDTACIPAFRNRSDLIVHAYTKPRYAATSVIDDTPSENTQFYVYLFDPRHISRCPSFAAITELKPSGAHAPRFSTMALRDSAMSSWHVCRTSLETNPQKRAVVRGAICCAHPCHRAQVCAAGHGATVESKLFLTELQRQCTLISCVNHVPGAVPGRTCLVPGPQLCCQPDEILNIGKGSRHTHLHAKHTSVLHRFVQWFLVPGEWCEGADARHSASLHGVRCGWYTCIRVRKR